MNGNKFYEQNACFFYCFLCNSHDKQVQLKLLLMEKLLNIKKSFTANLVLLLSRIAEIHYNEFRNIEIRYGEFSFTLRVRSI